MPALVKLDPLPTHEMAIRLFYLYDHYRRQPVVDSFPDAQQVSYYLVHAQISVRSSTVLLLKCTTNATPSTLQSKSSRAFATQYSLRLTDS